MHREQYASYQLCENYKNDIYLPERKNLLFLICLNRTHQDPFFFFSVFISKKVQVEPKLGPTLAPSCLVSPLHSFKHIWF